MLLKFWYNYIVFVYWIIFIFLSCFCLGIIYVMYSFLYFIKLNDGNDVVGV